MDVKVEIDAESVNEAVQKAILESVIGDELRKAIKDKMESLKRSYDNPIAVVVDRIVSEQLYKIITTEYVDKIKEQIHAAITDEVLSTIIGKAFDLFLDKAYSKR